MLKIKDMIDLDWLACKYHLKYAGHCDQPGMYYFFSDTLYIDAYNREITIDGKDYRDLEFLYDLIQAGLVDKVGEKNE